MADYELVDYPGWLVAKCTNCGRRTRQHVTTENAAEDWNRRITGGARLVTLDELADTEWGHADDMGAVAVWIEERGGALRAALLTFGIDMGDMTVREYGAGMETRWSPEDIAAEGVSYRIWDKKPEKWERERAPWGKVAWKEARTARAEARVREALGR